MGRNTVREAVRSLVRMGKLEARQGDGTYVRSRSGVGAALARTLRHRELLKVYEVRASLERDTAGLAARRASDEPRDGAASKAGSASPWHDGS
ncbi:FadR/GntR family transcriptional regulator [Streptomyces acidicola]|uniref:FadR family transcriptional regulator n=1 Tax=Streptomyces acidicola TaxID=2596892 RepID=A0A5N8WQL6_9ACTN|nr:hypothetical protein [Streptomyces acidicola]MPY49720.1 FadR family transcriptional regulator [Streptomyces acidicola]